MYRNSFDEPIGYKIIEIHQPTNISNCFISFIHPPTSTHTHMYKLEFSQISNNELLFNTIKVSIPLLYFYEQQT